MQSEQYDRLFRALSDPLRRGMVERLSLGPASVKELAAPAQIALPSAVKHLKVLEDGGIVASEKTGRVRTYHIRAAALGSLADWVAQRERALNTAFDALEKAMREFPEEEG